MKKVWKTVLVLALAVLCLTAVAAAAEAPASGICNVTVESGFSGSVTWKAQKADGTQVTTATSEGVYADAVKLELTYTGADSSAQYLVLVLNDGTEVPTEKNVSYVDQDGGKTSVVFGLYPSSLTSGKTYDVYLSSNASTGAVTGMTKVASFGYYAAYKLGDVNEDGAIKPNDALCALQIYAGTSGVTWTENQRLAADVTKDGNVRPNDALKILQLYAGVITEF